MAEATTVMDPAAKVEGDNTATQIAAHPTNGPMGFVYRLTGGQSLRQVLLPATGVIVAFIGLVFLSYRSSPNVLLSMHRFPKLKNRES